MATTMSREEVLQALRTWLIATTGLASDRVLIANDDTMRPAMPYLTVRPLAMHIPIGTGEATYTDIGATQTEQATGDRRATIQVAAYGSTAADILDDAALAIDLPTAQAVASAEGIAVYRSMSPISRQQLRATAFEVSAIRDFEVSYRRTTTAVASPHAETLAYDLTIQDDPTPPADLVESGSVDVS